MAVKFSQFTTENNAANVTHIVGYFGTTNAQIPTANLDTTYTLGASGTTDVVLTLDGTKPGGTATDSTITITKGTGITFSSITSAGFTISASGAVTTVSAITPAASTGDPIVVTPTTGDVTIQSRAFAGGSFVGHVPSASAASAGQYLDYQGNWTTPSGGFTAFNITGDNAVTESVGNGDTVTFTGGTYIDTAVSVADTVTIDLDTSIALWELVGGDLAGTNQSIAPGNTATFKENTSTSVNSVRVGGGIQTKAAATRELLLDQTSEQVITVPASPGNKFYVDGAEAPTIVLPRGFTYEFNQDDSTNDGHPLVIGTSSGSSPYATGIQYYGSTAANTLTAVSEATYTSTTTTTFDSWATRRIRLRVTQNTPALYYYCSVHGSGMGGSIAYGAATGLGTMTTASHTGNGSTATYALSATPTDENYTIAYISGVYQLKSSYTVSGSNITFDTNVPNGASIEIITFT